MKSAEVVEAIREEVREDDRAKVREAMREFNWSSEATAIILDALAGKPTLKKGQLMCNTPFLHIAIVGAGYQEKWHYHPLLWSDGFNNLHDRLSRTHRPPLRWQ